MNKMTKIRIILTIATIKNLHLFQLDVQNVFLHVYNEEVYMKIP